MTGSAPRAGKETPGHVPILTYHSLDDSGSVISVAGAEFSRQMKMLREWGYTGMRLGDLLDVWEGKAEPPNNPVVIVFDDGFRTILDYAAPALDEIGFGATVFVVADYCGRKSDWPGQPPEAPRLPLLSWDDLKSLANSGFEIGAHTLTHPPLTRISIEEAEKEIAGAKQVIEDKLGTPVKTFAYPYGLSDRLRRDIAKKQYQGACGVDLRVASRNDDRYDLPRVDMYYFRTAAFFRLFPTHTGRAYIRLRRMGRGLRKTVMAGGGLL